MSIKHLKLGIAMLSYISLVPIDLGAAEFSQVRPSNDEFMQLPTENWLKNGGDLSKIEN